MKQLLSILIALSLFGCCPKITTTSTVDTVFSTRVDTVYQSVAFIADSAESKVIDIDLKSLCDSLYSGQLKPQTRTSEVKRNDGTRQLIAKTEIDSMLHLIVSCKEDAYRDTLDSVRTLNMFLTMQIDRKDTVVVKEPLLKNLFFWLFIGMIVLTSYFAFRK